MSTGYWEIDAFFVKAIGSRSADFAVALASAFARGALAALNSAPTRSLGEGGKAGLRSSSGRDVLETAVARLDHARRRERANDADGREHQEDRADASGSHHDANDRRAHG